MQSQILLAETTLLAPLGASKVVEARANVAMRRSCERVIARAPLTFIESQYTQKQVLMAGGRTGRQTDSRLDEQEELYVCVCVCIYNATMCLFAENINMLFAGLLATGQLVCW